MSDRLRALKLNKKLMFGVRFFIELKTLFAVVQLFYLSRGLSTSQIIYLSLFWSITTFIFDIPSSILADKYGRKKLIMVGVSLIAISTFLLLITHGFLYFVLVLILNAIGVSFVTGADQAILYDGVKEAGEMTSINRVSGKYFSSGSLPKVVMPLIGSLIAKDLLPWQFTLVILIDFTGMLISLILASLLTEPKYKIDTKNKIKILVEGFKLVRSNSILIKLALNKSLVFEASFVFWRIYQVVLQNAHMPIIYLGLVYTVFQSIMFLTHWNTEKVQKFVGLTNFALIPQISGFLAVILILISPNLIVLFISTIIVILTGTFRDPFFYTQMQARIPSFNRATATSTLNLIKNSIDIPILFLVGYLTKMNINYVLITSAVLFGLSLLLVRIKKEDVIEISS